MLLNFMLYRTNRIAAHIPHSIRILGVKLWNTLSNDIKYSLSLAIFNRLDLELFFCKTPVGARLIFSMLLLGAELIFAKLPPGAGLFL